MTSAVDVPGFPRSAMDGYAIRGEESFGASAYDAIRLDLVGLSLPGSPFDGRVERGQAVRIMTGAPIPDGADAVVKAEVCEEGRRVDVSEAVAPRKNVGAIGEDIARGDAVLTRGPRLRPQDAGLLSSIGRGEVACVRRPRVRLVVTGDELLPAGSVPSGSQIVDSNSVVLRGLVARDGGRALPFEILPDVPERIREAMASEDADVVLVSGGTSVGQEDHAPRLLSELGELAFHGISMRPSSPTGIGRIGDRFVFLLPGNPVSCLAAYEFFAGPTIRALGGRSRAWPHRRAACRSRARSRRRVGRTDYVRVAIEDGAAVPLATSGASILSSTVRAAGAVIVPRELEGMPEGAESKCCSTTTRPDFRVRGSSRGRREAEQFLEVLDRDEAESRWRAVVGGAALASESVALEDALGRVLAQDVRATVDVPGFDRSNMDGFAVRAADTFGASEEEPVRLRLNDERSSRRASRRKIEVAAGHGDDDRDRRHAAARCRRRRADRGHRRRPRAIRPRARARALARAGRGRSAFAGTDMGRGETVLFAGTRLTSRETGVLAAIGRVKLKVMRRPRVAILSTGDEIVQPGEAMRPGLVYDSNGAILADAVAELGGEPVFHGAYRDDVDALRHALHDALAASDMVLLSGGTSKGEGDLNGIVVGELEPGILVHGVALKPGKPICLAAHGAKPVVILPGFPTSAIFTFHEFVAPLIRDLAGSRPKPRERAARAWRSRPSERGRPRVSPGRPRRGRRRRLSAYPMGKGSGSVTSFSRADGFVRIGRNTEMVEADTPVEVTLIGREVPRRRSRRDREPLRRARCDRERVVTRGAARETVGRRQPGRARRRDARRVRRGTNASARPRERCLQRAVSLGGTAVVARVYAYAGRRHAARGDPRRSRRCSPIRACGW